MDGLAQATRVIFGLDCAVSFLWWINSWIMIAFGCWDQLNLHIIVGVHFGVQTVAFAFMLDDQYAHELEVDDGSRTRKRVLPRHFPTAWIVASIYTLLGDAAIIALDAHNYQSEGPHLSEACLGSLQYELFVEALVTAIALLSIAWYAALNIERRWKRDHPVQAGVIREKDEANTSPPMDEQFVTQMRQYMDQYGVNVMESHLRKRKLI